MQGKKGIGASAYGYLSMGLKVSMGPGLAAKEHA